MPMRLPLPAPSWSRLTTSSPSPRPSRDRERRLHGIAMIQRAPTSVGWTRDRVTVPITSPMRMAVQFLKHASHSGRTRARSPIAAQPQQFLALIEGPAGRLDRQQIGPEPVDGLLTLRHRPDRDGADPRHLVRHTATDRRVVAEYHRTLTATLTQTLRHAPRPDADLAVAGRQRSRRRASAGQRPQRRLEHGGRPSLDGVAPPWLHPAVARHRSGTPITNQRAGEVRDPTSSRAPEPSLLSITSAPAAAPNESIASSGS